MKTRLSDLLGVAPHQLLVHADAHGHGRHRPVADHDPPRQGGGPAQPARDTRLDLHARPGGLAGGPIGVAGSMMTIASVTFSITIVALQLASSQFGPRLLRNFMRDRGNQSRSGPSLLPSRTACSCCGPSTAPRANNSCRTLGDGRVAPGPDQPRGPDLLHPPRGRVNPGRERHRRSQPGLRPGHRPALTRMPQNVEPPRRTVERSGRAGPPRRPSTARSRPDRGARGATTSRRSTSIAS